VSVRRWLAVLIATAIAIIVAAVAFRFIVIPYQTPGSQSVPLTVVARNGPQPLVRTVMNGGLVYGSEAILASPSIADLSTLVLAQSGRPDSCPGGNCWRDASVPNSSLLIALPTPAPCRRTALSVAGASDCPAGSLSFASVYWLLAVPRDALPSSALVIVVDERAQGIGHSSSNLGVLRRPSTCAARSRARTG
jgi:hypothetical protein